MELLPDILDEITLDHITPKLPWKSFHILSSVSSWWRKAIQSRLVHDARAHAHSTETLLVHNHSHRGTESSREVIALYSTTDKRCYELPPIPAMEGGIPRSSRQISLDGKVYVLGGVDSSDLDLGSAKVFVLDVAGQRQWEECASMEEGRRDFGIGVVEGKIYVFGGLNGRSPLFGCEVYDPKVNAWASIMPMPSWPSWRAGYQVATVGKELFLCGGEVYDPAWLEHLSDFKKNLDPDVNEWFLHEHVAEHVEVYNTVKNDWRTINTPVCMDYPLFMAKGKLHMIHLFGTFVYDNAINSWVNEVTNIFPRFRPISYHMEHIVVSPRASLFVNDELFVRVHWKHGSDHKGTHLLHSKDFDNEIKEIRWQKANCSFEFDIFQNSSMCASEL